MIGNVKKIEAHTELQILQPKLRKFTTRPITNMQYEIATWRSFNFWLLWDFRSNQHVCKYWLESKLRTHITVRQKPKMGKVNVVTDVATVVVDIIKNKLCKHAKGKLFNFEATSA